MRKRDAAFSAIALLALLAALPAVAGRALELIPLDKLFGNPVKASPRISPAFHADKVRAPLILAQGANDPRVPIREADQMVEAMRAKGLPVAAVREDRGDDGGAAVAAPARARGRRT